MREYLIPACSGKSMDIAEGQTISVIDVEGGQVAFFAEYAGNLHKFLSQAVTIDCNESLKLHVGDIIHTNLCRPMFKVIYDEVGEHDFLFSCCRPEMYDFFYQNGSGYFRKSDCASRPFRRNENRVLCRSGRKACLSR